MKKNNRPSFLSGGPRGIIFATIILVGLLAALHRLIDTSRSVQQLPYSVFLEKVESNDIKAVRFHGQDAQGILKDGNRFETTAPLRYEADFPLLRAHHVQFGVESPAGEFSIWYLLPFISLVITGLAIWYFMRQARGGGNGGAGSSVFGMGKSKARIYLPSEIKENFSSVAGAQEAKEELQDVVDFLKNPEKYRRLGAKMTRGVLLVGEPGNGKTLLARAMAGEVNCPFLTVSGSDFIEVFVGVGAARVRDLFAQARKHAPSIIFIDEIDAVGRHRGRGMGGGHDEREQTLNQILTEMDGFQTDGGTVVVIAATNRADVLDKALLRPGRFDRQVLVPFPDLKSRRAILDVHTRGVKIDKSVDFDKIARGTPGFSGADLANLINEAAINASKLNKAMVTIDDFEEARDKIMMGKESKSKILTAEDRKIIAFHEAGHALVQLLKPEHSDPLHKITIIPRGSALGVTHSIPEREKYLQTKEEMIARIMSALGGRIAEELVFGIISTGAASDFQTVTRIARHMVCSYGMSSVGKAIYTQGYEEFAYSSKTAELIDAEVEKIIDDAYVKTTALLKENRDKLDLLSLTLLEKETMYAGEVYQLLGIEPRHEHSFN